MGTSSTIMVSRNLTISSTTCKTLAVLASLGLHDCRAIASKFGLVGPGSGCSLHSDVNTCHIAYIYIYIDYEYYES